ncbi:MAG: ATP-binding cassette domain-containing protein [Caldilineaceae bacterium]
MKKSFPIRSGRLWWARTGEVRAVDGVSFKLQRGEVLGVVGESGCGKSTLALTLLGLESPTAGNIVFEDKETSTLSGGAKEMRRHIQMIFQDPYESLNPLMTIGDRGRTAHCPQAGRGQSRDAPTCDRGAGRRRPQARRTLPGSPAPRAFGRTASARRSRARWSSNRRCCWRMSLSPCWM